MSRQLLSLRTFLLSLVLLLAAASRSAADPITLSTYREDAESFELIIVHPAITVSGFPAHRFDSTSQFSFWNVTVSILEFHRRRGPDTFGDRLVVRATAFHNIAPHDEGRATEGIRVRYVINASDFAEGFHGVTSRPLSVVHGLHFDVFESSLAFRTTGFPGNPEITGYRFVLTGTHVVPEPSSIALFGLGVIGLLGYARHRCPE